MAQKFAEKWLEGPGSTNFYTRTYALADNGTPKALVVFMHGFIEHIGRYEHVFPTWLEHGIAVFCMDERGFGRTAEDKEHRSKHSSYCKTSGADQLRDTEWAIKTAREQFEGKAPPTFLMGHSMGGGLVLLFATQKEYSSTTALLSGVIATSPLLKQSSPVPKLTRWAGGILSKALPNFTVDAPVNPKDISRDKVVGDAYIKDPLVKQEGTLRCISDIFDRGDEVLASEYKKWPESLPVLVLHGTDDRVTSYAASKEFINKVPAKDKTFSSYEGGYHELHNEPEGMKEKVIDECISWVETHLIGAPPTSRL